MFRYERFTMEDCPLFSLKKVRKFNCHVFMESGGQPWVADLACMGNGEIAVIDKWNSKLKVFNSRYRHRVTLIIPGGRSLVATEDDVIVVTGEGPLRLYSTDRGLTDITNEESTVTIENENSSLATNGTDISVLRYDERTRRACIQTFALDYYERFMHKSLVDIVESFEVSRYFATDTETNTFYIGDLTHNYIVGISPWSEILWKVKLTAWPRGIVLIDGHIFVATHFDHKIHCISKSGHYIGIVLSDKDGIQFPLALGYQKDLNRLLVQCNYHGDVLVFDVQRIKQNSDSNHHNPSTNASQLTSPNISHVNSTVTSRVNSISNSHLTATNTSRRSSSRK